MQYNDPIEIIEYDNSSHDSFEEISEIIIDNISDLINNIEKYSDISSNNLWTDIYQKKTGITEEELYQIINAYKDFFSNEKLIDDKRVKLVKLIKNMIYLSNKIK